MNTQPHNTLALTTLATMLAAYVPAEAAEVDEVTELSKPESTVQAGVGYVNRDNQRFGQYTGLNEKGAYGLLDLDLVQRDDATGTWLKLSGRNLGLDDREVRVEHRRQGDWGYFIDFSQIPRFDPYTVNTGLSGIGSIDQTVNGEALRDVKLDTRRDIATLGVDKQLSTGFDFQVRFRNEEKEGARRFGQGNNPGAPDVRFLTDPIDYTTKQIEATLGYTTERLQVSGGYYGTTFDNHNPALNINGGIAALGSPLALPPGNQSHQLFVTGGYNFTPTTRSTFKAAYTHQTQDEGFVAPSTTTGRSDLGGEVNTTLLQLGLTAKPIPKLSLLANLRYEDKDDKTPIAQYFTGVTGTSTLDGSNEPRSLKTTLGKLEAGYALPMNFRVTGGVDYEERKRNTYRVRSVSHRDETDETSYRAELRRSMSETITGALAYVHSKRDGSPFLDTVRSDGSSGSNLIAPIHLADRDRDKVRLSLNWMPTEPLSLQFFVDQARDEYGARTDQNLGVRSGKARNYSVDAAYTFSETWQATAWLSRNDNRVDQASQVGAPTGQLWGAQLRNLGNAVGLGVRAKATSALEIGADLQYSAIRDEFEMQAITGAAVDSLPAITTHQTSARLFGKYALQRNAGVRVDYVYDRFSTNDWTWTNWVYTDGTRVLQDPKQTVHFVGISYYYKWR